MWRTMRNELAELNRRSGALDESMCGKKAAGSLKKKQEKLCPPDAYRRTDDYNKKTIIRDR